MPFTAPTWEPVESVRSMTSSAEAISRVVVFLTTPTKREPSTLTSSTCTSEGGASFSSWSIGQQLRRDLARWRFLGGFGVGGIEEVAQRDADTDSQDQAGYADEAPGFEFLGGGAVGQIERVSGCGTAGEKALRWGHAGVRATGGSASGPLGCQASCRQRRSIPRIRGFASWWCYRRAVHSPV